MSDSGATITGSRRLGDIAGHLGLRLHGDPAVEIDAVGTLTGAGQRQISFLANPAYRKQLAATRAAAVIVPPEAVGDCPGAALEADEPYAAWARLLEWLHPPRPARPGIDPSAVVDPAARVDDGAEIGPLCHVGPGADVSPGVILGPGSIVGAGAVIGADCRLLGRVFVGDRCRLGRRVIVHPGAVIGADGYGLAMDGGRWRKVAQLGAVRIGDDCEIGANTTIDRGAIDDTVLGVDVRLDNQVQVAHNCEIGDHTAIAGCTGIAGSTRIGRYCMVAGACGIAGHLEICDRAIITGMSAVTNSIHQPGRYGSGIPARPMRAWQRILVRLSQLDRLFGPGAR
ncbi:MAG: UDP-3-O-(3-hydroxymyristoyl)glucosamine N-acyltransferase [Wenzhouxiangellaceae bacterium]|nr:UDP-3-O-(3-hydroxymyristoyl)glucosamine N-acyltransferase [Wenzhouxiangellaceae bacterium]